MEGHSAAEERSILIIADKLDQAFYRLLAIEDEDKEICTAANAAHVLKHGDAQVIVIDAGSDADNSLALVRSIKQKWVSVPIVFIGDGNSRDLETRSLIAGAPTPQPSGQ